MCTLPYTSPLPRLTRTHRDIIVSSPIQEGPRRVSNPTQPDVDPQLTPQPDRELPENFGDLLSQFERTQSQSSREGQQITGTVIAVSTDTVFVDIGYKSEGVLPLALFTDRGAPPSIGDKLTVSVKGRNPEGFYDLSRIRIEQPKDWNALERAFADGSVIAGTVTAVVKGGLTVDVGLRAFLPASRSGARDLAEMEQLVGQEIRCRITKLDVAEEDLVVDRRVVIEAETRANTDRRYAEVNVGDIVAGTVRSLTTFGAFIDLGGVDGLLHIGEISWSRIGKPEDVLSVGQQVEVKVLTIDPETRRIALSMRQLLPHPWESVSGKYKVGDRVRGTVTRLADFGAFLELEPGIEGLIHISEMSWGKKVRKPSDVLTVGDTAEAIVLAISPADHRLSLGLKQALGDPWVEAAEKLTPGSVVEGEVASITKFGAFLQLSEGVQGMVHISEITGDRRLNHPSDMLRVGQQVKAKVLDFDKEKRQLRLSIKQLVPTGLEDFLAEHKPGDLVSGRVLSVEAQQASVELGEGIVAVCSLNPAAEPEAPAPTAALDLSSLGSMLSARWKSGASAASPKSESVGPGQVRSFRITDLDPEAASIKLQLAG